MSERDTWPTLEAFYDANPARRRSGEADFGVMWHEGGERWPQWRVSYIQATGEVYAVQMTGNGMVRVLGTCPPDEDTRHERGCYDGQTFYRTLDKVLDGWADSLITSDDLAWIERRLALQ